MTTTRHGLSIGIERIADHFFLSLKAIGKLSHDDYEVIMPMIDSALKGVKDPVVDVFIDASEFAGWELRAAWDDLKLGLKHGREIRKLAICGNSKWQKVAAAIGAWFIAGETGYFEDAEAAMTWLKPQ